MKPVTVISCHFVHRSGGMDGRDLARRLKSLLRADGYTCLDVFITEVQADRPSTARDCLWNIYSRARVVEGGCVPLDDSPTADRPPAGTAQAATPRQT